MTPEYRNPEYRNPECHNPECHNQPQNGGVQINLARDIVWSLRHRDLGEEHP